MSNRLPKEGGDNSAYARYSWQNWQDQDAFYQFWIERWKRSIDFLRSVHWRALQETDLKLIPEWKRFPVINMTLAFYSDYLTQWLQSRVRFSAVPDSPDPKDISSAEASDFVLKYLWDLLEVDNKKTDIAAWLAATGNADVRAFWDTDTGDMIPLAIQNPQDPEHPIPVNPQTLQPDPSMQQPVMVDAGEIGLEVIPPQLVRCGLKKSQGKQIGYLLTYDEACGRYGDEIAGSLSYGPAYGSLTVDLLSVYPAQGMPQRQDVALAIEQYLPRSSKYPKGLWWTSSADRLITPPQPMPTNSIPSAHFRWIPLPGHPEMGLTPLYDITFSNKTADEMQARILEWLNKVVPKIIRQNGDGLPLNYFTDEPGQEAVTQPGTAPNWMMPTPPPPHFAEVKANAMQEAMTVGGYNFRRPKEPAPGQSQSFRAPVNTLNQGEVVALSLMNSQSTWQKLGYILLEYAGKFYQESRAASIVGTDRTYQWREFTGSDLAKLPKTIHVDELPLFTWNRQSMRDTVIGVLSSPAAGVLFAGPDGQIDKNRVNAAMDAAGIDVSPDVLDADYMEAMNENQMFRVVQSADQIPKRQPWQNDEKHYEKHIMVPKSLEFRAWPEELQKAFLGHLSEHEQAMQQLQKQQQDAMYEQERTLRQIRADAETTQDVKTAVGKESAKALGTYLQKEEPPVKGKEKK